MYIHVKSTDCLALYPHNKNNHFFVKLPEVLSFSDISVKCALVNVYLPPISKANHVREVLILANFIKESYIGEQKLPILQRFILNYDNSYSHLNSFQEYVKVKNIETDIIEITVLDGESMKHVKFTHDVLYCTFHISES